MGLIICTDMFLSRRFLRIVRQCANQDDTESREQLYSGLEREKI